MATPCAAQEQEEMPDTVSMAHKRPPFREVPNPEKMAQQQTDTLNALLNLTEKQYKKVYKLNLKEAKEMVERMANRTNNPRGGMGQRGQGMPGRRPSMSGGGTDMSSMMGSDDFDSGDMSAFSSQRSSSSATRFDPKAALEERKKKMKKILTDEQYATYEQWLTEQAAKRPQHDRRPPRQKMQIDEHQIEIQFDENE